MSKESPVFIIWVDEAGRWAWAGPVSAAAFLIAKSDSFGKLSPIRPKYGKDLRDSKKLSEKRREYLFDILQEASLSGLGIYAQSFQDNTIIDVVGIREANRLAMENAIREILSKLHNKERVHIQIDGKDNYTFDFWTDSQKVISIEFIVRWDDKVRSIQAASIIAKVSRDREMRKYGEKWKNYGFEVHKGYGTALHSKALEKHGILSIHRKSYAPIARLIQK